MAVVDPRRQVDRKGAVVRDVGAVIVCGGQSRRMGRPKAWLPLGDEVLLQRVVRLVAQAVDLIVVVAAPDQALPPLPASVHVVHDLQPDRGPLQGLASGLSVVPDRVKFVYATGTDAPFLAPGWMQVLRERIGEGDVAIPWIEDRFHPLAALYRCSTIVPAIDRLLKTDRLRMMDLVEAVREVRLDADDFREVDPRLRTLENLNTPEDYHRALDLDFK